MRAVSRVDLLPVGQLNHEALEPVLVKRLAVLVEHAEAPHDLFQMLELVVQHAERTRRASLGAAHHVAFEEELRSLGLRAIDKPDSRASRNNRNGE